MFLPENARKLLVAAREKCMDCKTPDFPEIVLTASECGTFKYCKNDKFLFVVFPETKEGRGDGLVIYAFFKRDFSNFSGVAALDLTCDDKVRQALLNVRFFCGEQIFKAMCAVLFVDAETGKNSEVLEAVLNAPEPSKAKSATFKLKDFDRQKWDDASLDAMTKAQFYKLRDSVYRDRFLDVARIAKEHNVEPRHVYFIEATEATPATETKPEFPPDRIWGSGVGVARMYTEISTAGFTEELRDYLSDPIRNAMSIDGVQLGANKLGVAMKAAFDALVGDKFEFFSETMEQFLQRGLRRRFFDMFEYEDVALESPAKRSRSEEFVDLTCQESVEDVLVESQAAESQVEESQAAESQVDESQEAEAAPLCRTLSF